MYRIGGDALTVCPDSALLAVGPSSAAISLRLSAFITPLGVKPEPIFHVTPFWLMGYGASPRRLTSEQVAVCQPYLPLIGLALLFGYGPGTNILALWRCRVA